MTLQVFTSRINYGGPDRLDITRKSAGPDGIVFAPSWGLLRPILDARARWKTEPTPVDHEIEISALWDRYREAFLVEMRESYRVHRATWKALLARPRVVLVCYCTSTTQCHRRILAGLVLPTLGAVGGGEIAWAA